MTVIIVDDCKQKRQDIMSALKKILEEGTEFIECECRNEALFVLKDLEEKINKNNKEYLLVLDMCFPILKDSMPELHMGLSVLNYLQIRGINIPTIMCSSDEIVQSDIGDFDNVIGTIKYDSFVLIQPLFEEILNK